MKQIEIMNWDEIRWFVMKRQWFICGESALLSADELSQLRERDYSAFSVQDQERLSIFIFGYLTAKG